MEVGYGYLLLRGRGQRQVLNLVGIVACVTGALS